MGNLSVFMVHAEMTVVKDSKEWCLKLGYLSMFACGVLFLCTLCFVGAPAFLIVRVSSNLFEAGTTFSVEAMYPLVQSVGF